MTRTRLSVSILVAAAVGLAWVPFGILVCNPGQSCPDPSAFGGAFVALDILFYVVPQYLALMWLTVDVAPRLIIAIGASGLTLSLSARGPWNPAWMILGAICAALAWWLSGWISGRDSDMSLIGRAAICASVIAVYWVIGSQLMGRAFVVDGPVFALVIVVVFGVWRYTLGEHPVDAKS